MFLLKFVLIWFIISLPVGVLCCYLIRTDDDEMGDDVY